MFCPKCNNDNLANTSVCFFCGEDIPKGTSLSTARRTAPARQPQTRSSAKRKPAKRIPKHVDIHLPNDGGSVRITFLKPPYVDEKKVRLQYRGIDGRFRRTTEISSPVIKDIIESVKFII